MSVRLALLAPLLAAAPLPQSHPATRVLDCRLPYTQADALMRSLAPLTTRDWSRPKVTDLTLSYAPAGVEALGAPASGVVRTTFQDRHQIEQSFAARVPLDYATAVQRMLTRYGQAKCQTQSVRGSVRQCLIHLRMDSDPPGFDVDVQVGERAGLVQFECLYGDLKH
jgi:hypothetical protein